MTTRARELFRRGAALAHEERWGDALAAFEQSALLLPHGATLYDVGYCERALGHPTRARRAFTRALARPDLPEAMRADAGRYLAEADAKVGRLALHVASRASTVTIDGRPLEAIAGPSDVPVLLAGTREPGSGEALPAARVEVWLDPGTHVLATTPASGAPRLDTIKLAAGGALSLTIDDGPVAAARPVVATPDDRGSDTRRFAGWALTGAGGVALLASGFFAVRSSSRWSDAKSACPARVTCPDDRGAELSNDARRDANLATAGLVVSLSAFAGAGVLFLGARGSDARPTVSVAPGSVQVGARF